MSDIETDDKIAIKLSMNKKWIMIAVFPFLSIFITQKLKKFDNSKKNYCVVRKRNFNGKKLLLPPFHKYIKFL